MDINQMQYKEERSSLGIRETLSPKDTRQSYHIEGDAVDRYPIIIQSFIGKPVRFFKVGFDVEISDTRKFLQTWAIPLTDLADAVNYPQSLIRRMVLRNLKFFLDFYKADFFMDNHGHYQNIILIPIEMLSALTMGIHASTKNSEIFTRTHHFQRWVMVILSMIRGRELMPVRWMRSIDIDSKYIPVLSVPSGRGHKKRVIELAKEEGKSLQAIYRHLGFIRGSNIITARGIPRRSRKAVPKP